MSTLIGEMIESLGKNPANVAVPSSTASRKKYGQKLSELLLQSHRYHLSSRTASNASSLGFSVEDIGQVMSLARPPFTHTWFEWNLADQFEPLGIATAPDAPKRVGGLVTAFSKEYPNMLLFTSIMNHDSQGPFVSPVSILFDPDDPLDKEDIKGNREFLAQCLQPHIRLASDDKSRTIDGETPTIEACLQILDSCLVGGALVGNQMIDETFEMVKHASYVITPQWGHLLMDPFVQSANRDNIERLADIFYERIIESSGFARFMIGALALLNTTEYVKRTTIKPTDKKPPPEALNKRRSPVYDFVEITAPHQIIIREVIQSQTEDEPFEPHHGKKMALHEVGAHYAHSRKIGRDDCSHNYEKTGPNRWICLNCGKKRWRRGEYLRGNPELGVIEHKNRIVLSEKK